MGAARKIKRKQIPQGGNKFAPTWGAAHKAIEDHVAEVRGQMLVTLLGFLHQHKGFGKKRLEDFSRDYMTYLTDMQIYRIAPIEIKEALKEECGFDTDSYYGVLQEMTLKQVEEAKEKRWEHRKEMEQVLKQA